MTLVWGPVIITVIGLLGGILNNFLREEYRVLDRIVLPKRRNPKIVRSAAYGTVAALISWGLFGPLSDYFLLFSWQGNSISLSQPVGALLIGVGASRLISDEKDKEALRNADTQLWRDMEGQVARAWTLVAERDALREDLDRCRRELERAEGEARQLQEELNAQSGIRGSLRRLIRGTTKSW